MKTSAYPLVLCVSLLAGCVTPKDTYRMRQNQVVATSDIPDAIYASTEAEIAKNPALMDSARAEHAANKDAAKAEFDKVNARLRQTEKDLATLIDGLAKVAGVSPVAGAVANQVGNMIKTATGLADDAAKTAGTAQKTAETTATKQEAAVDKLNEQLAAIKDTISAKTKELEGLQAAQKAAESGLNERFTALDDKTKQQIKEELVSDLEKNGATKEELEKYRAMSPAQLYALLLAGGGVGLTALVRTLGKSRGQGEIDQQWDEIKGMQVRLANIDQLKGELQQLNQRHDTLAAKVDKSPPPKAS